MKYFTFQGNDYDCGFASLKMLLAYHARDKSYLYLQKGEKRGYFTVDDIVNLGKKYGAEIEASKCNDAYINEIKEPCLVLINYRHIVMLKKVYKHFVILYDPGVGRVWMKKEKFMTIWNNIVLELNSPPTVKNEYYVRNKIIPQKLRVFHSVTSLISSAILIGIFYLLNDSKNALYSLVFIGFFASAQMLENVITYFQIYQFDKNYMQPFFSVKDNQSKIGYIEYENFKRNYFTTNRSLLSSIIVAFLVCFLLIFNDFRNGFVLLALILVKMFNIILFTTSEKENVERIENCENSYYQNPSDDISKIMKANRIANMMVFKKQTKQIASMILSFAFALIMMIVTGNSGCNYVIFHFGLYFVGSNAISSVISGLSNSKEFEKSEARFFDKCNL